jgi:thymidine kinase
MLEVILGPMFSGKTTALLSRAKGRTQIINHVLDTRTHGVKTHDGVEKEAMKCNVIPFSVDADTVLIDEAQFFESLDGVETLAPNVVVAGLSGDFRRKPFGRILELIPKADKVTVLTAICDCGEPAPFTKRISVEKNVISVQSSYKPKCGRCF